MQLLRRALGALGGALLLKGTIGILASFSQAMSTVKAITQATGGEFKQLRSLAEELGATTRFTGTQAAEGMLFLARAGFTTSEVLVTVKDTLLLAQAGALDLGRAADIASNVLKGFNLDAVDLGRVVDVLALTANSANTNIEQLGAAMSFVAPVAAAVGVSVELASAAVGALSDAGVQATRAGTGLRQIFVKLLDPTEKGRKTLRAVGIATEDLNITTRGLIPVLQTLADAELTVEEAAKLVGVRQAANILILTKAIPKITELSKANDNAAGTALRVATIMDDNLNGALLRVKSAFESIILSLGRAGTEGSLTGGFNRLASLLRLIAANADTLQAALSLLGAVILGKLVALVLPALVASLTAVVGGIAALATALVSIQAVLLPIVATVGAAVSAVVLGAAAVASLKTGKSFGEVLSFMKKSVVDFSKSSATALGEFAGSFLEPTRAVADFGMRISDLIFEMTILGATEELTADNTKDLLERMQALRGEISQRLLFQEFLSPGAEGVKDLREQLRALDESIKTVRKTVSGEALIAQAEKLEPDVRPTAPAIPPRLEAFLQELRVEGELIQLNNRDRAIRETLIKAEDAAGRGLKKTEEDLVTGLINQNLELEAQRRILDEIKGPQEAFADGMRALNALGVEGVGSQEAFIEKTRELRIAFLDTAKDISSGFERGLAKVADEFNNFAVLSEAVITNAFRGAEDALTSFVTTGKADFRGLIDSIIADLVRLAIRKAITGPLSAGLEGALGAGEGGGFRNPIPNLFGGAGGGGDIFSTLGGLLGFRHGGQFEVSQGTAIGSMTGGLDNRLVAFRARDRETVTVTPPGGGAREARPARPIQVIIQISGVTDADSFRRSKGQVQAAAQAALARAAEQDL